MDREGQSPALLRWTTEPPFKPGWYWVARDDEYKVLSVYLNDGRLTINWPGIGVSLSVYLIDRAMWAGPIPFPEGVVE